MKQRSEKQIKDLKSRVLGAKTFGAIAAVEGLSLSASSKNRLDTLMARKLSPDARRAEVIRIYTDIKGRQ